MSDDLVGPDLSAASHVTPELCKLADLSFATSVAFLRQLGTLGQLREDLKKMESKVGKRPPAWVLFHSHMMEIVIWLVKKLTQIVKLIGVSFSHLKFMH